MRSHRVVAALPLVLLAAACSSGSSAPSFSQPKASAFHTGACRSVADAVLSLGRDAHALAGGTKPDPNMAKRLNDNQTVVFDQKDVSAAEKPAFEKLVVAAGIVRIRNDSNTYDTSLAAGLVQGYEDVVAVCVG